MIRTKQIEEAKQVLREAGYFTDNLWHIQDVKLRFNVTNDEDAHAILEQALTNDYIMEQIHNGIYDAAVEEGFKTIDNDE